MFQWLGKWTEKLRNRRQAVSDAFYRNKRYDLATIDAKYELGDKRCLNCNTVLTGPFCRTCGQKDDDLRRPIWSFFKELLDALFDADNKIFKTIIMLMLVPGGLTRAFMEGRRASFSPPIRTYLVVSVMFFLFLSASNLVILDIHVTPKPASEVTETAELVDQERGVENIDNTPDDSLAISPEDEARINDQIAEAQQDVQEALKDAPAGLRDIADNDIMIKNGGVIIGNDFPFNIDLSMFVEPAPPEERSGLDADAYRKMIEDSEMSGFVKRIMQGLEKMLREPDTSNEIFNDWLPPIMIVLIPLFALILRVFHWGKRRVYLHQLIFSLHYHTFLFVLMGSLMIIVPRFGGEVGAAVFWFTAMIYLFIALKVGQNQGWIRTFFKFWIIWTSYIMWLSIGMFTALTLGLADV